jgi:hypothetical protein
MSLYDLDAAEQNQTRATWAATALEAFGTQTGQTGYFDAPLSIDADLLREIAGDLLANLFHLARINGVEPGVITEAAFMHFEEEVREEEDPKKRRTPFWTSVTMALRSLRSC